MNDYINLFVVGVSVIIAGIIGKSLHPEMDMMIWNIVGLLGVILAVTGVVCIFIVEGKTKSQSFTDVGVNQK